MIRFLYRLHRLGLRVTDLAVLYAHCCHSYRTVGIVFCAVQDSTPAEVACTDGTDTWDSLYPP